MKKVYGHIYFVGELQRKSAFRFYLSFNEIASLLGLCVIGVFVVSFGVIEAVEVKLVV